MAVPAIYFASRAFLKRRRSQSREVRVPLTESQLKYIRELARSGDKWVLKEPKLSTWFNPPPYLTRKNARSLAWIIVLDASKRRRIEDKPPPSEARSLVVLLLRHFQPELALPDLSTGRDLGIVRIIENYFGREVFHEARREPSNKPAETTGGVWVKEVTPKDKNGPQS